MAALRNNDSSLSSGEGNGGKATLHQCHSWLKGSSSDGDTFREHAERMLAFRQSHGAYRNVGSCHGVMAPLSTVNTTVKEAGDQLGSLIVNALITQCPENDASRHQFSAN